MNFTVRSAVITLDDKEIEFITPEPCMKSFLKIQRNLQNTIIASLYEGVRFIGRSHQLNNKRSRVRKKYRKQLQRALNE